MKLNQEQAKATIEKTIENKLRHQDYYRTVDLATLYKKYITGQNISSELIQFNPREDAEAFKQRATISSITTPALLNSVMKPFYKVPRTDRVVKKILPKTKGNTDLVDSIQEQLNLFYGSDNEEGGLDFWLKNRFVELSFIDPNTFIVIEFNDFDAQTQYPQPYPFEVSAEMAINFEIENNNVDWLIVQQEINFISAIDRNSMASEHTAGKKYYIYCGAFSFVYRQVSLEQAVYKFDINDNETVIKIGDSNYAVSYYDTMLQDWQMFRIGYMRDLETDSRTFVAPFHPAMPHLKSCIKDVSELCLAKSTHVFPQKLQYVTSCPGMPNDTCNKGRNREGLICERCDGEGVHVHTSSQDVITMPLPDNAEEKLFPLRDLLVYVTPPIELLDFMDKQVDKYDGKIHQAIFNTTVLVQKTVVATATEKDQDMDSVYDTLTPFANKSAAVYLNIANAVAYLLDKGDDVTFVFRYPADFKMKSRQILYTEMKTITESGAPSFVRESVEDDLAEQIYQDNPEGLLQYKVKTNLRPFGGKNDDQIAGLLSSALVLDETKILWNYFDDIMKQAELENKSFYVQKYKTQKEIIDKIVADYKLKLTPTQPIIPPVVIPE